jgi:L-asparaginase II
MCGSLSGQDYHVEAVSGILSKIGLSEEDLQCGVHPPLHRPTARQMEEEGKNPRPLHHNCAGKHAGMLAVCVHCGWPTGSYPNIDNPVQQTILNTVSRMTGVPKGEVNVGVDGCGVPTFAVPLKRLAFAYARLAAEASPGGETASGDPLARLVGAALEHPEMIAGEERICTDVMRAARGRVFAKSGSEGSYALALMGEGVGVALKIEDGNPRAVAPTVIEVLRQRGILVGECLERLRSYGPKIPVYNFRKEVAGEIKAVFQMANPR